MTKRAGSENPGVSTASPVAQPPMRLGASTSFGPAPREIAPHTPPPPHAGERADVVRHVFERRVKHVERNLPAGREMRVGASQARELIVAGEIVKERA